MTQEPDTPILMHYSVDVLEGHLEQYKAGVGAGIEFLRAQGPQPMVHSFVDEGAMRGFVFQLYRSSDDVLLNMQISEPYISETIKHCVIASVDIYGEPSLAVMDRLRSFYDQGVRVSVTPHLIGFTRG